MLHIIYRSYGGENKKGRPAYYSKLLALSSLVRAFRELPVGSAELVFLNDGPIPANRLSLMQRSGEVVTKSGLGLRGSMHAALSLPLERKWAADDLVWLAEDDYLYLPHSLVALLGAAKAFPDADYFGLYAQIGEHQPNRDLAGDRRLPAGWQNTGPESVQGTTWRRALSTTSTFGARVQPLLQDRRMMHLVMKTGGAWDHSTSLIYQGFRPYPLFALFDSLKGVRGFRTLLRASGKTAVRAAINLYPSVRAIAGVPRRTLISADPALITHLEDAYLASGTDWSSFAHEMERWTVSSAC